MSGGNGDDRGNGAETSPRSGASASRSSAGRPDKPTDLPPLRSFSDRLPWLPWALVALLGVFVLVLTLNALDFSRREQLLERRLDIAIDEQEDPQEALDAQEEEEPRTTPSTSTVPLTTPDTALAAARQRDLQDQADDLLQRADELDRREADLDAREEALGSTVPTTSGGAAPTFADGIFLVGVDLPAGIYRTNAPAGCRYTKIAADGLVIRTELLLDPGPATTQIGADVHQVNSDGCGTWTMVE